MTDEQPGADATAAGEPSTVDAPMRWSGSAAVPPPAPRKSRWSRRRAPDDAEDDWAIPPPVDPWEGQDTPWDPMPLSVPAPPPPGAMPPTRLDPPAVAPPPTRVEPPAGPAPAGQPAGPAPAEPPVAPAPALAPKKRRWGRKPGPATQQPVNRVPVAARPAVPFPPPPPQQYQRRAMPARPASPPVAPWRPPAPQNRRPLPPPPPRRRRRWPRNLAVFTLLSAICCCGVPALFIWPAAGQFPVTAVLPDSVSDLDLRDDAASRRAAQRLSDELSSADAFAGIYADGNGKRVTIFGTTGLRLTPEQDVEAQIKHLTADYDIRDVQPYDVGEPGVHERCGIGRASGRSVVICVWADHGSLVTVLLTRRSVADSAELTSVLRSAVLVRG
jgi:hypothetical protein